MPYTAARVVAIPYNGGGTDSSTWLCIGLDEAFAKSGKFTMGCPMRRLIHGI